MADIKNIGESEAFRTLNVLIDQKCNEIQSNVHNIKYKINQVLDELYSLDDHLTKITTRISYDSSGDQELNTGVNFNHLTSICDMTDDLKRLESEIKMLQQYKLRLADDWDFTHGDDSEQKAIFGNL